MALVGKADILCDHGERLIAPTYQGFSPFDPPLHDITLCPDPDRLLEGAAEVIGAETRHPGEISEGQPIVEMGLDVVATRVAPVRSTVRWTAPT